MKILHISPSYYPAFRFGGPIQSVHLLNKALAIKGVEVDVLTTNAGLSSNQRTEIGDQWNQLDGVKVKYLSFVGYEHYNFSVPFVLELKKIIKNYDIVHITAVWNFPVLAGSLISKLKKKPYIISPNGVFHRVALTSKSGLIKKFYFKLFAEKYLKKAAAIHYTSVIEKEESELILNHKNTFVIPNGLDLEEIKKTHSRDHIDKFELDENKKYFLILGRIDKIKGFDLLIPVIKNFIAKGTDTFLVIAGNDKTPYTQNVKEMVKKNGVEHKVIFTGEVTGDVKWVLYKNALAFVLPSYSENFGMSVVEAMACGCPVVISNKVGISSEVEKNEAGIIVETNTESLEKGIKKLLADESLRNKISVNGRAMVEKHYDINKVAQRMIEKYKQIIEKYNA